ncbi:MAG: hypothetical protein MUC77_09840 [Chromatiaceae bacterium]|jgi:hypothetical protein|nr:hypothetical protein [Chromatiaceae bacterium]
MLTCKDASHLLSERQERPLGLRERCALRLHLWMCVSCRRFARQLGLLRRGMAALRQQLRGETRRAELSDEARARIRRALAEREGPPRTERL